MTLRRRTSLSAQYNILCRLTPSEGKQEDRWSRQENITVVMIRLYIKTNMFFFLSWTRTYVAGINRPFSVRFDPYTYSVEVLDNPLKIQGGLEGVKDDLKMLTDALGVLSWERCGPVCDPPAVVSFCCALTVFVFRCRTSSVMLYDSLLLIVAGQQSRNH